MIKQLSIKNFQSHKDTELEFHPGVNIIVGSSDSGKTAIIRALRWVVQNRPLGDSYRSHWGGDTEVVLHTSDNTVKRIKSKTDEYLLNPESESIVFRAFGTSVPEEIDKAINITDINLQSQHDPAFLISSNSGEVSRHFNRIARIEEIDSSLKKVESWYRKVNQSLEVSSDELDRHKQQLHEYRYIDKLETEVEILESLQTEKTKLFTQKADLRGTIEQLQNTEQDIQQKSVVLGAEKQVDSIISIAKKRGVGLKRRKQLTTIIQAISETAEKITEASSIIFTEAVINQLLDLYNKLDAGKRDRQHTEDILKRLSVCRKRIQIAEQKASKLEQQWHDNMPEVCPLCGKEQ